MLLMTNFAASPCAGQPIWGAVGSSRAAESAESQYRRSAVLACGAMPCHRRFCGALVSQLRQRVNRDSTHGTLTSTQGTCVSNLRWNTG